MIFPPTIIIIFFTHHKVALHQLHIPWDTCKLMKSTDLSTNSDHFFFHSPWGRTPFLYHQEAPSTPHTIRHLQIHISRGICNTLFHALQGKLIWLMFINTYDHQVKHSSHWDSTIQEPLVYSQCVLLLLPSLYTFLTLFIIFLVYYFLILYLLT